jgi:hypothetical protein
MVKRLPGDQREKLLREVWWLHDARWFLKVAQEYGFEVANKLNKITVRSMGKTELKKLLSEVGFGEVKGIEDFDRISKIVYGFYFPRPYYESVVKVINENSGLCVVAKCYVLGNVKKAGVTDLYDCACDFRIKGWLEACNLEGEVKILKSMKKGDPTCEILVSSIRPVKKH